MKARTESDWPITVAAALAFVLLLGAASDSLWSPFTAPEPDAQPETQVADPVPYQTIEPRVVMVRQAEPSPIPRTIVVREQVIVQQREAARQRAQARPEEREEAKPRPEPRPKPEPRPEPPSEPPEDDDRLVQVCVTDVCVEATTMALRVLGVLR